MISPAGPVQLISQPADSSAAGPPPSTRTRTPSACAPAAVTRPASTDSRPADRSAPIRRAVAGGIRWRCTSQ